MLDIRLVVGGPYPDEQAAIQANNGVIPPDNVVLPGNSGRADQPEYYVVSRTAAVSGNDIRDAQPSRDENGRPDVNFHLSNDGGRRFQQFTRDHLHERLAIVLDNRVREAAEIHDEIRDNVQITGAFTEQQTQDLSMMLRSGALPASHSPQASTALASAGSSAFFSSGENFPRT